MIVGAKVFTGSALPLSEANPNPSRRRRYLRTWPLHARVVSRTHSSLRAIRSRRPHSKVDFANAAHALLHFVDSSLSREWITLPRTTSKGAHPSP